MRAGFASTRAEAPLAEGHAPVLLAEVLDALQPRDGGRYVDGTFGGGGYTRAILDAADCKVVAIDRDPDAIARGQKLAAEYEGRLELVQGNFSEMDTLVEGKADGVVLDLGVSSFQLDQAERGFSFRLDAPLDMRMSKSGPTAADVVNTADEKELTRILSTYGEERQARRIARAIIAARPIERTAQLAEIVSRALGPAAQRLPIHPATRTFQALRIQVNDELGELERGLEAAERTLAPNGRLVVVSFHSLEDRIVKRFLVERSDREPRASRHAPETTNVKRAQFRLIETKAVKPGPAELESNPRARSARLRVGERLAA
jgi:16S rRNA (cytosine1402-N4)-methyltransferase